MNAPRNITPAITPPDVWAAYDELPAVIRKVMHTTRDPFDPVSVLAQWRQVEAAGMSARDYARWLQRAAGDR